MEKKENEKLFNFKKVSRKDHNTIDIDWLSNIKPIYIDTGSTNLIDDVLYSESNDFIFLNTYNRNYALDVVNTIIAMSGGVKKFIKYTKHELDEITKSINYDGFEYISCYDCDSFRISCLSLTMTFEVKIERIKKVVGEQKKDKGIVDSSLFLTDFRRRSFYQETKVSKAYFTGKLKDFLITKYPGESQIMESLQNMS